MTFRQFAAFAEVAKQLNITKAARALRMSQPSLSKHLKGLEEDYKIKLFTRYAKGIRLTDEGQEFSRYIEPILAQFEKLNQHYLNGVPEKQSERLKIGGTYGPSSRILPFLVGVFRKRYSNIDVVLRSNSNDVIHNLILSGELEMAITSRMPHSSLLYAESFMSVKRVAFVGTKNPLAKKNTLTLSDLESVPLIIRGTHGFHSSAYLMLNELKKRGYKLSIAMRCESPEAVKAAVGQGLGIGFLYYDAVKAAVERGSFKIIQIQGLKMEGQTSIVYHAQRPLSPSAEDFLKLLRQWRDNKRAKTTTEEKKVPPAPLVVHRAHGSVGVRVSSKI
jgi:DNA-binding transcriptional LysR family regulator